MMDMGRTNSPERKAAIQRIVAGIVAERDIYPQGYLRYLPHQNKREMERRKRQMEKRRTKAEIEAGRVK